MKSELTDKYVEIFDQAYQLLRSDADAADVVHDSMVDTMSRIAVRDPVAYCMKVMRRKCYRLLKRRQTVLSFEDIGHLQIADDAEVPVTEDVWRYVNKLPDNVRALVVLHDVNNYTFAELADLTGMSVSGVRKKVQKAHALLKKQILEEQR